MKKASKKQQTITRHYVQLSLIAIPISLICCLLAFSLKFITERTQEFIYHHSQSISPLLFIILPSIGITCIYFLRKYLFSNRKNKGITEIYNTLDKRKDHLPFFKIPSHYINGFLTVIFGGSTGIEVSTVVATATVGNTVYEQKWTAQKYKRELVCAGVTAGVAILFGSPLTGLLFALEVIAKKLRPSIVISSILSAMVSWLFIYLFESTPFFPIAVQGWHWYAIPFFILLSLISGALSVYFTRTVIKIKTVFANISSNFIRVNLGAIAVGLLIFSLPTLYGDSYHGLKLITQAVVDNHELSVSLFTLLALVLLKPLAAALTLGAGGDGGVFAPSIVAGAFLGLLFAYSSNYFLGTELQIFNFVLVGAAATLSASIFAPLTAIALVCSLAPNAHTLLFPIIISCLVARYFAQWLLPYNVYTYDFYRLSKES